MTVAASPAEVTSWWEDRVLLVLPPAGLGLLDAWHRDLLRGRSEAIPGWRLEGPGRTPSEASPLIGWLRGHCEARKPFTFNALWKERQGGRSYPYFLPGYAGSLTISQREYTKRSRTPKHLLSAIRRDVRGLLAVPKPWSLLSADFKSCHGYIAFSLSEDERLGADLAQDFHGVTGDWLLTEATPPAVRRHVGKVLNNAMLFGLGRDSVQELLSPLLPGEVPFAWGLAAWDAWWRRYRKLAALRDGLKREVAWAQARELPYSFETPSGRTCHFSSAEVQGRGARGRGAAQPGLAGAWRPIFSALFRAVEGDLLDQTLRYFHALREAHGSRLVLPLYDGLFVAAPQGGEVRSARAITLCGEQAATDLGLLGLTMAHGVVPVSQS